mmetsp:Transcript_134906/g.233841  ORF Transcript_134906/g.233841 Transcript_134906/m.233841 type:complete len:251 (+) Transcript_134906:188-940(+)
MWICVLQLSLGTAHLDDVVAEHLCKESLVLKNVAFKKTLNTETMTDAYASRQLHDLARPLFPLSVLPDLAFDETLQQIAADGGEEVVEKRHKVVTVGQVVPEVVDCADPPAQVSGQVKPRVLLPNFARLGRLCSAGHSMLGTHRPFHKLLGHPMVLPYLVQPYLDTAFKLSRRQGVAQNEGFVLLWFPGLPPLCRNGIQPGPLQGRVGPQPHRLPWVNVPTPLLPTLHVNTVERFVRQRALVQRGHLLKA